MNQKLIEDIRERVKKVNAERIDESILGAHLDAIAEVYETDRQTVESIARDVIAENGNKIEKIDLIKLRNTLWVSALILIIISVLWLLYSNLQSKPEHQVLSKSNQRTVEYAKEALASLNIVKLMVAEGVASTGQIASSFEEIGIKESEIVLTKYIDRIHMDEQGTITADFSKLVGYQRYIKLKPIFRTASFQLEWDCRSNLEQLVIDEIKGCTPD